MLLKELMVYKNLYNRLFFSLFFFIVYFISINNKYLLLIFGTIIYLLVFYETFKFFKIFFRLIVLYLFLSYFCFALYFFIYFDYLVFNVLVFTIILFDTFSYFTGTFFGKNYIFKYLSPKKTLEGYLGGIFCTNIALISYFYLIYNDNNFFKLIIFINLLIFISIFGDLIESYFKRKNNIKDSSKYLSGHGGYFDRFDSFIASIIFLTIYTFFYN